VTIIIYNPVFKELKAPCKILTKTVYRQELSLLSSKRQLKKEWQPMKGDRKNEE
jgi:hypothetical protein